MRKSSSFVQEPIRHFERPGKRVLNLQTAGVPFIPILSQSEGCRTVSGPAVLHVHPGCIEIVYCRRGVFFFETPDHDYPFLPETVFTSRDDEPHRLNINPKGHFVYRVLVEMPKAGKGFPGLSRDESRWLAHSLTALPRHFRVPDESVCLAFARMFAAWDLKDEAVGRRAFELRNASYSLLLAVVVAAEKGLDVSVNPRVMKLVKEMEVNPVGDFRSEVMCRDSGLSLRNFNRAFQLAAGIPPQAYLRACKIRRAQKLLDGGQSVTDVALELGFSSSQYFATVFGMETGMSPTQWRNRNDN